jgi:hypothetical protein
LPLRAGPPGTAHRHSSGTSVASSDRLLSLPRGPCIRNVTQEDPRPGVEFLSLIKPSPSFSRMPGPASPEVARAGTEIPQQELQPERCLADSGYTYHKSRPGIRPLPSLSRPAIPVEIRVLRSNGVGTSKGSSALMTPSPFARQSRRGPSPGRHPKSAGAASGNYSLAYLNSGKRTANRARTAADATSVLPRNHRSRP